MPITQERMIALTNAALDYKHALFSIADRAQRLAIEIAEGKVTAGQAFDELLVFSNPKQLLADQTSDTVIALESRHWHREAKRNVAERLRARRRRGSDLAPDESARSAPRSLDHAAAAQAPQNIIRQAGLARSTSDYMRSPTATSPSPKATRSGTEPDPVAMAGARLSAEARAAIDREINDRNAVVPGLTGDLATDVADDLDDPSIPQAPEVGDGDD